LGTCDKDGFGAGGLVAATSARRRDADEFCRGLWWSAIGRSGGELILDNGLYIVDAYEDILRFEIYGGRGGVELSVRRNGGVEVGGSAPV
jgi:hypothetical protein